MMSRPTLAGNFCACPTPHLGRPRRKRASYPGLNTISLGTITTIRAHSALIPPPIRYSAVRGKESIVTQWFELLIGHHHATSEPLPWHLYRHHHGTHGVAAALPLARPGTTVEWYRQISPIKCRRVNLRCKFIQIALLTTSQQTLLQPY